jgi:hypothetical protein
MWQSITYRNTLWRIVIEAFAIAYQAFLHMAAGFDDRLAFPPTTGDAALVVEPSRKAWT